MGSWVLALLMALFLPVGACLADTDAPAARSLEDLVRASDLIVLGRLAGDDGPGASPRLEISECLLGEVVPGSIVPLAGDCGPAGATALWLLTRDRDGSWRSLEPAARCSGWREDVRALIGETGLRLVAGEPVAVLGGPVLFELELRNPGDRPHRFPLQRHADGRYDITSLELGVSRLTADGPVMLAAKPRIARIAYDEGLLLEPGARRVVTLDLTELVVLTSPGTYRIVLSAPSPWGTAEARLFVR